MRLLPLLQLLQRLFAGLGLNDVISRPAQVDHDKAADAGLVLQHQYFFHLDVRPFHAQLSLVVHSCVIRLKASSSSSSDRPWRHVSFASKSSAV